MVQFNKYTIVKRKNQRLTLTVTVVRTSTSIYLKQDWFKQESMQFCNFNISLHFIAFYLDIK